MGRVSYLSEACLEIETTQLWGQATISDNKFGKELDSCIWTSYEASTRYKDKTRPNQELLMLVDLGNAYTGSDQSKFDFIEERLSPYLDVNAARSHISEGEIIVLAQNATTSTADTTTDDNIGKLGNDVGQLANAVQDSLQKRASEPEVSLDQKLGTNLVISGIGMACRNLKNSMENIKFCLNALYGIPNLGDEGRRELDPFTNRWRALNGQGPLESSNSTQENGQLQAAWNVTIYPEEIQPQFVKMRAACQESDLSEDDAKTSCLMETYIATSNLSDMVSHVLEISKESTTDPAQLRGLDQGIENIQEKCTVPIQGYKGGATLRESFDVAMPIIETCASEIGFVMYGHIENFQQTWDRPADNSTPYYRALQDVSGSALNLQNAMS
jgi:hypothetical protein